MLKEIKGGYNPHNIESDIEQFWQENNIYNKVRKKRLLDYSSLWMDPRTPRERFIWVPRGTR